MNYLLLLLVVGAISPALSQDTFYLGNKSYPATETFTLYSPQMGKELDIFFAKTTEGGFIVLNYRSYGSNKKIMGNIRILLDDKSFITCIDRGIDDYVNNTYTKVYKLTKEELTRLSYSNIYSLRYTVKTYNGMFTDTEDFSVINYPDKEYGLFREVVDVPAKVRNLLQHY